MALEPRLDSLLAHTISSIPPGPMNAGARLRALREEANCSLDDVSDETGIPKATVRFWESVPGRLKIRKHGEAVKKIAEFLEVSENVIWYGGADATATDEPELDVSEFTEEVNAFLVRVYSRHGIPSDLRQEAKELLKQTLRLE